MRKRSDRERLASGPAPRAPKEHERTRGLEPRPGGGDLQPGRNDEPSWEMLRERIIGLGERSMRKSYYPELVERLADLERFRALLDRAHDAIVLVELPSGRLVDANEAAFRLLGRPRQELLGLFASDVITLDGGLRWDDFLACQPASPPAEAGEPLTACSCRAEGSTGKPIEMTLGLVDLEGKRYAVVVARDVTERRRAAAELAVLERRVRQKEKLEALGSLAGGIAHDLGNLLTPLLAHAELALRAAPGEGAARKHVERVRSAGLRLRDLVGQIMTFAREGEARRARVSLAPLIHEVIELERAALADNIEIRAAAGRLASDEVLADATELHQVVMNLCVNAAQAIGPAGGIIEVSLEEEEIAAGDPELGPGRYVRLSVHDTGGGMSGEVIERIFEPFFSTKRLQRGTGLGLAVVHGIVKRHEGAIRVESEPGRGTTFHVLLPRAKPDVPEHALSRSPHEAPAEGGPAPAIEPPSRVVAGGTKPRILVVDDEKDIADMEKELLEELGYEVTTAADGREALGKVERAPAFFDLVVADQSMPHMTGASLTRELARLRPELPVVLATGHGRHDEDVVEAKAREVLVKPITIEQLAAAVRRVLGERRAA